MTRSEGIDIRVVEHVDDEILAALRMLLPQLSATAAPLTAEAVREIVGSPCTTLLVAIDRTTRQIVGSLTLALFRIPTGIRAWIEDVIVGEAARGRGIGEALTREAVQRARDRHARTVELTSSPRRAAANRLYQRLGFELRASNVYRLDLSGGA